MDTNMNKKAIEFNEVTDITTNVQGKKNTVFDDLISTNISKYQSFSENNSNNAKRNEEIIDSIKDTLRHKQCRFVYQKDGSYYEQGNENKIREKIQYALMSKVNKLRICERKYKRACNTINTMLQIHSLEYIKLRYNQYTWSNRHDKSGCEEHKMFKVLYQKYMRNKKIIDVYHANNYKNGSGRNEQTIPMDIATNVETTQINYGSAIAAAKDDAKNGQTIAMYDDGGMNGEAVVADESNHINIIRDCSPNAQTVEMNYDSGTIITTYDDGGINQIKDGTWNEEAVETDDDNSTNLTRVCSPNAQRVDMDDDSGTNQITNDDCNKETVQSMIEISKLKAKFSHCMNEKNNEIFKLKNEVNSKEVAITNIMKEQQDRAIEIRKLEAKLSHCMDEKNNEIFKLKNEVKHKQVSITNILKEQQEIIVEKENILMCRNELHVLYNKQQVQLKDLEQKLLVANVNIERGKKLDQDHVTDIRKLEAKLSHYINEKSKLEQDRVIEIQKFKDKLSHCMNEKHNEILKLKNDVESKRVAITKIIKEKHDILNDKTKLITRIDEAEHLHRNQMLLLKNVQDQLRIANLSVEEKIVSGNKMEHQHRIDIRNLEYKLSDCMNEKSKLEQDRVIKSKPNAELTQSTMNGNIIQQGHKIICDRKRQTIRTNTCITSPTFPTSTDGVCVGIYAHKKSKCKNICIKMNNNTLIS